MSGLLTIGDGERAMLPMEALSSSTDGAVTTQSAGSGLILILNFFLWSSSSSDSSEEKKWVFLVVGGNSMICQGKQISVQDIFDIWLAWYHKGEHVIEPGSLTQLLNKKLLF